MSPVANKPVVSIIVPMYNVGTFACPCLKSLLAQTYKDIEILVINDGSTDNTMDMVRDAVGDDRRVRIFDKENGGLSSARNYGTERCAGEYIMYMDGDDLIDPRCIEQMVNAAIEFDVPLVAGSFAKVPPVDSYEMVKEATFRVESGSDRLRHLLLLNGESGSAWGKLYARSLAPLLRYPEGQFFEDLGVTATVFSSIDRVAVTTAPFYAYVTRPGSITTLRKQGPKHVGDMNRAIAQVRKALGNAFEGEFECFTAYCSLRVAMRVDLNEFESKDEGMECVHHARQLAKAASRNPLASRTWRLRCGLFAISPVMHNILYSLYGRVSGKVVG